jgi:peptidyl-prolyl cis-trans isomerase C
VSAHRDPEVPPRSTRPASRAALALAAGLALLAGAAAAAAPPAASGRPPQSAGGKKTTEAAGGSDVVARVNGHPILRRDFDLAVQIQFRGRRTPVGLNELQAVRDKVLEGLIENELLYQKAVKSEPPVPDADVEAEFQKMKDGFTTPDAFSATLKKSGVGEAEFKEQLRRTLLVTRFVDTKVAGDLKVPDEDVRRYYDQNPAEVTRKEAVRVSQILVRVSPDAEPQARAAAREKIEAILKEVKAGGDFAELARKYSDRRDAQGGGDSGWIVRGKGPPVIEAAAFALQEGQTSDVVESRIGFHILKVLAKRGEGPAPFDEVKEGLRAKIAARERGETIRTYVDSLKEQARVERELKKPS